MAILPELTCLFTKLAFNLRRSNASDVDVDDSANGGTSVAISSLAESLNAVTPRVRVLDAALSLMCFQTPEVFRARIECLVRTLISLLDSMATCRVFRLGGGDSESIRVGSSVSSRDCDELIRVGADALQSLEGNDELSKALLYAILKAAVSSSSYQMFLLSPPVLDEEIERTSAQRRTLVSKLMSFVSDDFSFSSHKISMRLFLWYLDPLILKHTISEILREAFERPFLCLKTELHARMSWRSVIICLVASPAMFQETRALLHTWFLLTGSATIWKVHIAIISVVLDALSRPMSWDVSMEMGLKLPFSYAYFSRKRYELLAIITGPVSSESFLDLLQNIGIADATMSKYPTHHASHDIFGQLNAIHKDSTWALLMSFPAWFYFATILLFSRKDPQDSCLSSAICGPSKTDATIELQKAAALYLSWVLSPLNKAHHNQLSECLLERTISWTMTNETNYSKEHSSNSHTSDKKTLNLRKKLRIPKVNDCKKLHLAAGRNSCKEIEVWLNGFDGSCAKLSCETLVRDIPATTSGKTNSNMQLNFMLFSIPLGILLTDSSNIDEMGCELILHYANTGVIQQLREMPKETEACQSNGGDATVQALNGACLVFNLFDIVEDISMMLFSCEDTRADFICQLKGKVSGYLLRCLKKLLELPIEQFQIGEVGERAMMDLPKRLKKWMQQGREVFEGYSAFHVVTFARR
ncbi:uncharacterized protein M6B38_414535 [Iris pallida]|uniref:Uncharacterized protein n=1 Tax=Iris pallida TaxID=29817 RepID=A0AAX6FKJ7_IRIPA|nr:uncharacterized protein M6B38_414535 [Iris pallida]